MGVRWARASSWARRLVAAPLVWGLWACPAGGHDAPRQSGGGLLAAAGGASGYPTRSRYFGARSGASDRFCAWPDQRVAYEDFTFFDEVQAIGIGAPVDPQKFGYRDAQTWKNMGFAPDGAGVWRRQAKLDASDILAPAISPALPDIDCIAISTIDRRTGARPYLYRTLESLFGVLPPEVPVNLVVGNTDTDYVADARLAQEGFSPAQRQRLNVVVTPKASGAFLAEHFGDAVCRRASWNYARVLRSYSGDRALLFLEDDVDWADFSLQHLSVAYARQPLPVVSLFNLFCAAPGEQERLHTRLGLRPTRIDLPDMDNFLFYCTQAMLFSADIANELGRFIQVRMHQESYDKLADAFMHHHGVQMGHTHPSLVQHVGQHTVVESTWFPQSPCFVPDLPVLYTPNHSSTQPSR